MATIYEYPGATKAETYELENLIADPDRLIEACMDSFVSMDRAVVMDVGAGSGFHVAGYAKRAAHVYAVEPDPGMIRQFHRRFADMNFSNISLLATHAEDIPLQDATIDICHSRFAYFFGSGCDCDRGIDEAKRLLKPGGHFFIVDNCYSRGQFAGFLQQAYGRGPDVQRINDQFYAERGFESITVDSCWRAGSREELRRVIAMEFPEHLIDPLMDQIEGVEFSYSYTLYHYASK